MCSRRLRGYILPSVSGWGVWRGMPLEAVGDNHSPAPIYVRQWDIVVLDRHLFVCVGYMCVHVVLDMHLVIFVGYMCVHMVLDRHLVCLVLAALWLYVKWGAWRSPDARGEWPL